MDHQQNYEFNDPNSFGFNSFAGSENFLLTQPQQEQQQLNGKDHNLPSSIQELDTSFDSGSAETSQFISESAHIIYELPEITATDQQTADLYPNTTSYLNMIPPQSELNINSQKNSMFNLETPSAVVPANIIQQNEPEIIQPEILSSTRVDEISTTYVSTTKALRSNENQSTTQPHSSELTTTEESSKQHNSAQIIPEQNIKTIEAAQKNDHNGSRKRRRRILQLNQDDSDEENELKKELLQISAEKDTDNAEGNETEDSAVDSTSDDDLPNDPDALKVRSLLKSAVIIHGPESKKKKKRRVLESDEEDEMQTSVDDIGLIESNENENEDELFNSDILVSEAAFEIIDGNEKLISIESPLISQEEFAVPAPPVSLFDKSSLLAVENKVSENETEINDQTLDKEEEEEGKKLEDSQEAAKIEMKSEVADIDPSTSVEAILDNIKPMADDDEFFKADEKSDDSDCKFVSNEEYFGTPDLTKTQPSGKRRRGPPPGFRRKRNVDPSRRKRSNKYEKDFVEGSSESEDTTFSEPSSPTSDSSVEEVRPKGRTIVRKSPVIVQTNSFSVTRVPIKKTLARKDRFYDRSRDIPNDVYFGDVKVPLHVLHTKWDSDAESSESIDVERVSHSKSSRFISHPSAGRTGFSHKVKTSYTYIDQTDDPKLSTLKEFAKICRIKINYARLFDGIRSTDDKCMLIRRILAQKGLQGEPTIAKCKQLRLDLQAKRESAELDKSLIIRAEGRTRRATRNVSSSKSSFAFQPSTSGTIVQPETLQTLSKIRRVVDSDSE